MRLLLWTVVCLAAGTGVGPAAAERPARLHFPPEITRHMTAFFTALFNDRFEAALAAVDSFPANAAVGPIDILCRATVYQAQMTVTESDSLRPRFIATLDTLTTAAGTFLGERTDSALAWYYLGQAAALKAVVDAHAGRRWSAFRQGVSAGKLYGRACRSDSSFFDPAVGLGSYRYWKSTRTRLLNWTPFFKDEREDGLRLLRLAVDSAEISADAARTSLIYALINERRFGEAISLADSMLRKYPDGLTFLWALGEAFFKADDDARASETYAAILDRVGKNPGNYYNAVEAAYYLMTACRRRAGGPDGRPDERLDSLRKEIGRWPIPEETRRRQAKKLTTIADGEK